MSSAHKFRLILRDLGVTRFWSIWSRSFLVSAAVRRCRRERGVREVLQCFRQTFRPRRTLLLAATAVYKSAPSEPCAKNISDDDLKGMLTNFDGVEELCRNTLFCLKCGKRVVIEKKSPGIGYCSCKEPQPGKDSHDGWEPYMEAENVIIWRKEYKKGLGLFAYKVYGRYPEVLAEDFAAIQVDGDYRPEWDSAVAQLSVVEADANGVPRQDVVHWEVLWPRLFANRDYVYLRRYKEFDVKNEVVSQHDCFASSLPVRRPESETAHVAAHAAERESVHSRAKRKSIEDDARSKKTETAVMTDNKVYVIISRSCVHPKAPATRHAIRVNEYWSNMVVRTIHGADKPGMEYVLTYYDEPAVGGMPTGVASWATGRAAPVFLSQMRLAASGYRVWLKRRVIAPAAPAVEESPEDEQITMGPLVISHDPESEATAKPIDKLNKQDIDKSHDQDAAPIDKFNEQDMESSKHGPELEHGDHDLSPRDKSTQTELGDVTDVTSNDVSSKNVKSDDLTSKDVKKDDVTGGDHAATKVEDVLVLLVEHTESCEVIEESNKAAEPSNPENPSESNGSWWRYLYPFYYFI